MENITISNFRRIQDKWSLDLSPITFFTGRNNSGKSSIIKALLLLKDYVSSSNHFELRFDGPNAKKHKVDSYSNAINWFTKGKDSKHLKFEFSNEGNLIKLTFIPSIDKVGHKNQELIRKGVLDELEIRMANSSRVFFKRLNNEEYQIEIDGFSATRLNYKDDIDKKIADNNFFIIQLENEISNLKNKTDYDSERDRVTISEKIKAFSKKLSNTKSINKKLENERKEKSLQLRPIINFEDNKFYNFSIDTILSEALKKYFNEDIKPEQAVFDDYNLATFIGNQTIRTLQFDITHLSASRNSQERLISYVGNNDISTLLNIQAHDPCKEGGLGKNFLKHWMKQFDIGQDIKFDSIEGMATTVKIFEKGEWINLVDKGFGAGQIFAIILRIALTIEFLPKRDMRPLQKSIILIEEPEANLHPQFQSLITEMLYELKAMYNLPIQFIIETHSEYLIRKSQNIVLEKSNIDTQSTIEKPTNVFSVYYFNEEDGPYPMKYKKDGKFDRKFSPGFFNVADDLSMEMYRLNSKK